MTIVGTPNAVSDHLLPEGAVSVFPNPNNGQFTLAILNEKPIEGQLKVTDVFGRTVQENPLSLLPGDHKMPLRLEGVVSGIYYVHIMEGGQQSVVEVVVF